MASDVDDNLKEKLMYHGDHGGKRLLLICLTFLILIDTKFTCLFQIFLPKHWRQSLMGFFSSALFSETKTPLHFFWIIYIYIYIFFRTSCTYDWTVNTLHVSRKFNLRIAFENLFIVVMRMFMYVVPHIHTVVKLRLMIIIHWKNFLWIM